ncbi:MAG: ABC transporter ATP-binding protein [Firmicutes bacterium]|nr:ABC transporter ATP-binding protein [Bacillota bacterium]
MRETERRGTLIKVEHLTKSYGPGKGVFDLSFEVKEGEIFGFIGPNGAGKTTTIRHLLGFIQPDSGSTSVNDLDSFKYASFIQKNLGYLPGEIAFFNQMRGIEFLNFLAKMRGMKSKSKMNDLIDFLDLDVSGKIKKMSKGMKQKLALVAAFMHDPEILILDEPTSGLDPLMQVKFVELILKEKKRGKTILMSSHSFEEIERTCDRALIIKLGKLVTLEDIRKLKEQRRKAYTVTFESLDDIEKIKQDGFEIIDRGTNTCEVIVSGDINTFFRVLSKYNILAFDVMNQSLEEIFLNYYKEDVENE